MQAEVFHLYHQGEQRGPYTMKQVNHLHRCGYLDEDAMYWREGMEQWQPVAEIVEIRRRKNRKARWIGLIMGLIVLVLLWMVLGPVVRDGWREVASNEFTAESAWWRARGMVRQQMGQGGHVQFGDFDGTAVLFSGSDAAVLIKGEFTDAAGHCRQASWRVRLRYDTGRGMWQPAPRE